MVKAKFEPQTIVEISVDTRTVHQEDDEGRRHYFLKPTQELYIKHTYFQRTGPKSWQGPYGRVIKTPEPLTLEQALDWFIAKQEAQVHRAEERLAEAKRLLDEAREARAGERILPVRSNGPGAPKE
jgi:hypothetical protein